jgi:hypothetical protein
MLFKESLAMRRALLGFALGCCAFGVVVVVANVAGHDGIIRGMHLGRVLVFQASFFSSVFGVIYASSLGAEAFATARLSLLLPQARWKVAGTLLLTDVVAVVLSVPLGLVAFYAPMLVTYGPHRIEWGGVPAAEAWVLPIAFGLAFYGLTTAIALRMRRWQQVSALIFPGLIVAYALAITAWPLQPLFRALDILNPLAYWDSAYNEMTQQAHTCKFCSFGLAEWLGPFGNMGALAAICAIGLIVALVQWQRLQVTD